jgi:hypothetical protein
MTVFFFAYHIKELLLRRNSGTQWMVFIFDDGSVHYKRYLHREPS